MNLANPLPRITQKPENPGHDAAFSVSIEGNREHPHFTFMVHAGSMAGVVSVLPNGEPGSATDWRTALTPEEKVNVMNRILATYRQRSTNESGFKVGALAVTQTGNLYVAFNGEYNPSRLIRMCAELKVAARAEEGESGSPEALRFTELYVQGDGPGAHIAGLCGDCTNLEGKLMDVGSPIYIFYGSDGKTPVALDTEATHIGEVKSGHAWVTSIGYLTRHRHITLDAEGQAHQRDGLAAMKREIRHWVDKPIEEDPNAAVRQRDAQGEPLAMPSRSAAARARGHSKLDVPMDRLNDYMREQIYLTVADRLQEMLEQNRQPGQPTIDLRTQSQDWIDRAIAEEVKWARCAVVQRDDGKLFAAVTIKSKGEPASENAESNAMNQARRKKGGIRKVWVMEMNPGKTEQGILRTSAPVAVERQLKAASKKTGTVDYYYIPFNGGGLAVADVTRIAEHREALQLFPTGHRGRHNEQSACIAARIGDNGGASVGK